MIACLWLRRRIGAFVDGTLEASAAGRMAAHLESCPRCLGEAESLKRVQISVRSVGALRFQEPDWNGFWPGVVRGIESAGGHAAPQRSRARGRLRVRWALGGAATLALATALALWATREPDSTAFDNIVSSASTEYPGGTMVYAAPDREFTVVWVFGDD